LVLFLKYLDHLSGEIISESQFQKRKKEYAKQGVKHFYFMSLKSNEVSFFFLEKYKYIDASKKGNTSRFMNHSCNPNCILQKWVVGNKVRIGIFSLRDIPAGTELTFDYQFERYGYYFRKLMIVIQHRFVIVENQIALDLLEVPEMAPWKNSCLLMTKLIVILINSYM
jgi:hypothetical protein